MKLYSKILLISIVSSLLVFTIINRIDNKFNSKLTSELVDNEFSSISIPANFNQNKYANSSLPDLTFAASKSIDAVVHVKNTSIVKDSDSWALQFFYGDDSRKKVGTGSGVIISPDGYITTNYHVIENSTEVIVTTKTCVGPSNGQVTSLNDSQEPLAPSISAALYKVLGTAVKPAR